jgi:hypothetical protein
MTTASPASSLSISALLDAELSDAATYRTSAVAPPWAASEVPSAVVAEPVERPEPYLSKQSLAAHYAMSVRWVELRMKGGLPHEHMDGRARFKLSETDPWLCERGHLRRAA